MNVKFKKDTPIRGVLHEKGKTLDVDNDLGVRLCEQGYAEPARERAAEKADAPPTRGRSKT